jgi:hypothetical protein
MRFRGNVGVHAKRNGSGSAKASRALRQSPELRSALDVEQKNAGLQCGCKFFAGLAYAGKDYPLCCPAIGGHHPFKLPARHHVEATSLSCQQAQDAQIGICFDRVADCVRYVSKRAIEGRVALQYRLTGIYVEWRAKFLGELGDGNVFALQHQWTFRTQEPARGLLISESGRAPGKTLITGGHFFLAEPCAAPCTRMATTV